VFIDETSVKTNLTRLRGRALKGQRLHAAAPFGSWNTQTFIAGLTVDGLIAPWVIKGAMDGLTFETYIRTQLAPALEPRTVVILDQPRHPQECRSGKGSEKPRLLVPVSTTIQPRPEPDRNGVLKAESAPETHWRQNFRPTLRSHWRYL
jgi:hypothetical protein